MSDGKAFNIDLGRLKSREKDRSPQAIEKAERAGASWVSLLVTGKSGAGVSLAPERGRYTPRSCQTSQRRSPTKPSDAGYSRAFLSKKPGCSTKKNPVFKIIRYFFCSAPTSDRTPRMRLPASGRLWQPAAPLAFQVVHVEARREHPSRSVDIRIEVRRHCRRQHHLHAMPV